MLISFGAGRWPPQSCNKGVITCLYQEYSPSGGTVMGAWMQEKPSSFIHFILKSLFSLRLSSYATILQNYISAYRLMKGLMIDGLCPFSFQQSVLNKCTDLCPSITCQSLKFPPSSLLIFLTLAQFNLRMYQIEQGVNLEVILGTTTKFIPVCHNRPLYSHLPC